MNRVPEGPGAHSTRTVVRAAARGRHPTNRDTVPLASPPLPPPGSPGALLQLIRTGAARTRAELVERTGLGRSAVSQRIAVLVDLDLVHERSDAASTGGRPPKAYALNANAGVVVAADLGPDHSQLAVTDLAGEVLGLHRIEADLATGPERFLTTLDAQLAVLLAETGRDRAAVRGVGIGLPGPVEFASGRPIKPSIMPGWDGFPVATYLSDQYGVPALVDNDVNFMAAGEQRQWPDERDILVIKLGIGVDAGIVSNGTLTRGHEGAAGDIGHVAVAGYEHVHCACGNRGCVEAVAGGGALVAQLRAKGVEASSIADVVALVADGEPHAVQLVREAGRLVGEVLAVAVNLLNPGIIVIGGELAAADHHLIPGIRAGIYQRSTPLATRRLRIERSNLGDHAGVIGAASSVIEHVLAPAAIDRTVAEREAGRNAAPPPAQPGPTAR